MNSLFQLRLNESIELDCLKNPLKAFEKIKPKGIEFWYQLKMIWRPVIHWCRWAVIAFIEDLGLVRALPVRTSAWMAYIQTQGLYACQTFINDISHKWDNQKNKCEIGLAQAKVWAILAIRSSLWHSVHWTSLKPCISWVKETAIALPLMRALLCSSMQFSLQSSLFSAFHWSLFSFSFGGPSLLI